MDNNNNNKLFETSGRRWRWGYKVVFSATVFMAICFIWIYRFRNIIIIIIPSAAASEREEEGAGEGGGRRWVVMGMLVSEVMLGVYWIFTQSLRWSVVYHSPSIHTLSLRYEEELPGVDIFVCTADAKLEPPMLVINTVLSVLAYNYPPEKVSVYLSDDGGSEIVFYALLEASRFCRYWIPFCHKFKVEPRSPEAYFALHNDKDRDKVVFSQDWANTKKLYEEMKSRIVEAMESGIVPDEIKKQHNGFSEWDSNTTKNDHHSIVKILIDGRDRKEVDACGNQLPTLVYLSREKKPHKPHNFKAGSMNALIRVSAEISNAPIILNLDCDMYSNNGDTIREALCFFMDEERGHQISYVQYPQRYANITKNDLYGNAGRVTNEIELAGLGGVGAALYCGTGCFHRRPSLCGKNYSKELRFDDEFHGGKEKKSIVELEEASKSVANCSYEEGTQWGKQMGLVYGCPVEDIVTGLTIQCRGWKSVYYNPRNAPAFLGMAPITLEAALVQHKRWSEGMFQIFISKYCPFIYGHRKIKFAAQMGYCCYLLWAPVSIPVLYYVIVPPLCLLHNISLFPKVTSIWFVPFAYVFAARNGLGLVESLSCGETLKSWWNLQRIWLFRRTTSYLFAFFDATSRQLGLSETASFTLTAKAAETSQVQRRYKEEIMEFGSSSRSILFTFISTLALLNLLGFVTKLAFSLQFLPQVALSGVIVMVNLPVYDALFRRKDSGSLSSSVLVRSMLALPLLYLLPLF